MILICTDLNQLE